VSLDPPKSDAELLAMLAQKQGQSRRASFGVTPAVITRPVELENCAASGTYAVTFDVTALLMPVRLRIPWSALASDNDKYGIMRGKLIAQKPYRAAKKAIRSLAVEAMNGRPPAACPLALVARVYVPDNRVHDVVNFSKCVHDALKGSVFVDDQWLHDVRWIRAGVDVDAPRCELTITPLRP
jgi:Holliday junction resolvase RusA-like endonuclease